MTSKDAEMNGPRRLALLIARDDVEDIHFRSTDATTEQRLTTGELVPGPRILLADASVKRFLRLIGRRAGRDEGTG